MEVCLLTTCHLLGISCHMGQAIRASFMYKEEIATQVLTKGCEKVKVSRNYYNYFYKRIIHIVPEQKKAKKLIVHKLGGVIVKLSHIAMEAVLASQGITKQQPSNNQPITSNQQPTNNQKITKEQPRNN